MSYALAALRDTLILSGQGSVRPKSLSQNSFGRVTDIGCVAPIFGPSTSSEFIELAQSLTERGASVIE